MGSRWFVLQNSSRKWVPSGSKHEKSDILLMTVLGSLRRSSLHWSNHRRRGDVVNGLLYEKHSEIGRALIRAYVSGGITAI